MNTLLLTSRTGIAILVATITLAPAGFAQTQNSDKPHNPQSSLGSTDQGMGQASGGATREKLKVASDSDLKQGTSKLIGQKVNGQGGESIGTVKDFLIDPESGEIRFAVISSGGVAGIGDTLHLVEFTQLQPANDDEFSASLTRDQLSQAPKLNEEQFEENLVSVSSSSLVRASKLKERNILAYGDVIGTIKDVVIRLGEKEAIALLEPENAVPTTPSFLVPMTRIGVVRDDRAAFPSTLTRADIQTIAEAQQTLTGFASTNASTTERAPNPDLTSDTGNVTTSGSQDTASAVAANRPDDGRVHANESLTTGPFTPSGQTAGSGTATTITSSSIARAESAESSTAQPGGPAPSATATSQTEGLTPTGQTSADQNPAAEPDLMRAAKSIRQSLDNDADLARADVTVTPESGKIVLRGSVTSEQKSAIEQKAESAAHGAQIDSQLKVE